MDENGRLEKRIINLLYARKRGTTRNLMFAIRRGGGSRDLSQSKLVKRIEYLVHHNIVKEHLIHRGDSVWILTPEHRKQMDEEKGIVEDPVVKASTNEQ